LRDNALEHKRPKLIHTDKLGEIELGALFNVIWCFSVLIHMENDVLEECLDMASRFGLEVSELGSLRSFGHVSGVAEQDEQRMLKFVPA